MSEGRSRVDIDRGRDEGGYGDEGYGREAHGYLGDESDDDRDGGGQGGAGGDALEFDGLKFSEDKDTIITCKVPPKLERITATMDA